MKLSDLSKGDLAVISKIETDIELKDRLYSFGMARGSHIRIEECSVGKTNIAIVLDDTVIGLRTSEAMQISVMKIET